MAVLSHIELLELSPFSPHARAAFIMLFIDAHVLSFYLARASINSIFSINTSRAWNHYLTQLCESQGNVDRFAAHYRNIRKYAVGSYIPKQAVIGHIVAFTHFLGDSRRKYFFRRF